MRILVTGGGGFLGSHIVDKLLRRGDEVAVFGRRDYPALAARGAICHRGDVADIDSVRTAAGRAEAVFHCAAIPGIWGDYDLYHRANVTGTENILAVCAEFGIGRLVYTSTPSVVHGGRSIEGGDESLSYPERYLTPYAQTKAEAEKLVLAAGGSGLAVAAIRPHLMFGPGDTQLIPKLLARARAGRLRRVGGGTNVLSVSYVENVADAHLLAMDNLGPGGRAAGQVYFVNEPEPVNCWDFINAIVTGAGLPPVTRSVPFKAAYLAGWLCEKAFALLGRKDDPPLTRFLAAQLATSHWFRTDKAQRELGWRPRVPLEEGVRRTIDGLHAEAR